LFNICYFPTDWNSGVDNLSYLPEKRTLFEEKWKHHIWNYMDEFPFDPVS